MEYFEMRRETAGFARDRAPERELSATGRSLVKNAAHSSVKNAA